MTKSANPKPRREWLAVIKQIAKGFLESSLAVLPIVAVIVVIYLTGVLPRDEFSPQLLVTFVISAAGLIVGLALFNAGVTNSMSRIGEVVGQTLFHKKKMWLVIAMTFIIGVLVTIAEPDLKAMASQIGMNEWVLIISIALGVGIFVVIGVIRTLRGGRLNVLFLAFYGMVFALAGIVNPKFLPVAFDSGGVTTGPVTVPFIMAFGVGLASSKSTGDRNGEDGFGLTALASVGPIIAVMIMGLFVDVDSMTWSPSISEADALNYNAWETVWPFYLNMLGHGIVSQLKNAAIAILPITAFFLFYNFVFVRLPKRELFKILIGLIYAYIGLAVFMTFVEIGFMPVAQELGKCFGNPERDLFPYAVLVGFLFGMFGALAEPAVHSLVSQVEKVSEGTVKSKAVLAVLALAVGGGVALAIVRAHYGFSVLYYLIPGYFIALGLSFIVPKMYFAMAFDSGGVASGPMASTFVMPFCTGFTFAEKGADYVYASAFGSVAMIALMPLIVVQLMGLYAGIKRMVIYSKARKNFIAENDDVLIDFTEVTE